tara:strand:- start:287 stop:607 length:321 start_codon:yes stop_codon:yes gene_type:complete
MYKPLGNKLTIGPSEIEGIGLIATKEIPSGTNLGMSHLEVGKNLMRTPLGGFINHKDNSNCEKVKLKFNNEDNPDHPYSFNKWNLITIKDIKKGEELTLSYTFYKI